jgi:hypothetical protein
MARIRRAKKDIERFYLDKFLAIQAQNGTSSLLNTKRRRTSF